MARPTSSNQTSATETSPLLPKASDALVEPSSGLVPDGPAPTTGNGVIKAVKANGGLESSTSGQNQDHEDGSEPLERRPSQVDRERHYEGMPEERKRLWALLPALAIGIFLSAADQTIVVSSRGSIGSDLHALEMTSWIATAYFLTLTSCQPLYGKLSDIFSRKSCLLFAYLVFGFGTLGCGLSRTITDLIISRALAGVGGGGMTTVVSILLSDIMTLRERGKWQGYLNIIFATGAAVGAPLGGFFSDGPGWRWAFLFQTPLCLVAFVAVYLIMKTPPPTRKAVAGSEEGEETSPTKNVWISKLKRIDFLGAITLICAVCALLLGLDRGSNIAWASAGCLVPLCLSVPLFAAFAYIEIRVSPEPIAPLRVLTERTLFGAFMCNFFSFAGYMATIFSLPLFYEAVGGYSSVHAALLLLPQVASGVSGSLFAGFFMQRYGTYRVLTIIAYANLTLGLVFLVLFTGVIVQSDVGMSIALAVAAFSNGIGVTTTLIALIANASKDDQAIVTACSYLFRSLGSTIGVSLSSSAANLTLRAALRDRLASGRETDKIVEEVRNSLKYIKTLAPHTREIVRESYAISTRASFGLQVVLVSGAFFFALMIRQTALSK